MTIGEQKNALRARLKAEADRHALADRIAASFEVRNIIENQPEWESAESVLFYMALPDEPDLDYLITVALRGAKRVVLPRYCHGKAVYEVCVVTDVHADLAPGRYGILEPTPECPVFDPNKLDLLFIPGVGFSLEGRRLGRGKGYYDRLLSSRSGTRGATCGVAFEWQVTPEIPSEAHDILLDRIVTPRRWHIVGK